MRNYTQRTKSDYFGKRKGLFYDGRELGKRLADEMGFSYYAKEIIGK